jgi:hypothetical protein
VNIEVICSDSSEHRRRVETRVAEVSGLQLPTWRDVENREYQPWLEARVVFDTAGKSEAQCPSELLAELARRRAADAGERLGDTNR